MAKTKAPRRRRRVSLSKEGKERLKRLGQKALAEKNARRTKSIRDKIIRRNTGLKRKK